MLFKSNVCLLYVYFATKYLFHKFTKNKMDHLKLASNILVYQTYLSKI